MKKLYKFNLWLLSSKLIDNKLEIILQVVDGFLLINNFFNFGQMKRLFYFFIIIFYFLLYACRNLYCWVVQSVTQLFIHLFLCSIASIFSQLEAFFLSLYYIYVILYNRHLHLI